MNPRPLIRSVGVLLLLIGGGIWLAPRFMQPAPFCYISRNMMKRFEPRKYCAILPDDLVSREKEILANRRLFAKEIKRMEAKFESQKMELTRVQRLRRESVAIAEPEELTRLRNFDLLKELEQNQLEEEKFWREAHIKSWYLYLSLAGLFALLVSFLPSPVRNRNRLPPLKGGIRRIREERELSELGYASAVEQGFADYEAAAAALAQDDLRQCSYCGEKLRVGELGEVSEIRYYKKRPADVSMEHRQYLGTRFHANPVETRECLSCGHTAHR